MATSLSEVGECSQNISEQPKTCFNTVDTIACLCIELQLTKSFKSHRKIWRPISDKVPSIIINKHSWVLGLVQVQNLLKIKQITPRAPVYNLIRFHKTKKASKKIHYTIDK